MKKAVAYARVSSKKQEDEGFSIPAQIKLINSYAQKNNIDLINIFTESETAKKAGRKAFNEMLEYIKKHNIDTILVEKTDRLYRNFKDYVTLDDYDLEIHLLKEGTVLSKNSKSHDKFIHGIKVLMAKNYIDNLAEEVKKGLREKVNQGYYPQKAPVGYINVKNAEGKKVIIPDKAKAPFVQKLFELYSTGAYSVEELRKKLFAEGFNHKGRPYSKPRLLFVLKDIFYIGKFIYSGVVYDGKHEPIISIEIFNRVQKMFNQTKARSHETEFAYTGLLTCGYCGCQMTAELKKGKYIYYHCTGKRGGTCKKDYIREEKLEEVFLELIDKLPNPDSGLFEEIKNAVLEIRKVKSEYEQTSQEEIQKQIARIQSRLDNLYIDKLDARITQEFWQEKHNQWHDEKDKLIEKLKAISNTSRTFDEGSNLLENFCKYARQEFLRAAPKKKQAILKMLGSNFVYKDKKVSVELSPVFNYLINNNFVNYGARHLPKSELYNLAHMLDKFMNQDFIDSLKSIKYIA